MFAAERQNKIKEILTEYKQINVSSLSSILNVTETTVRKDLEALEKEGFLFKTHGGAILNERHLDIQEGVYAYRISGGYLK